MLPGELLSRIRKITREPGNLRVYFHDDTRGDSDSHRAMLFYGAYEVCALPIGDIPAKSIYIWQCFKCREIASHPWVCRMGAPPPGIESRGLEHLKEPTSQGHEVIGRLARRGADSILNIVRRWRDPETGEYMVRM